MLRVRADYERDIEFLDAGAGDVGVIAAKDQRIYFNCWCVLRVRAEYELALRGGTGANENYAGSSTRRKNIHSSNK